MNDDNRIYLDWNATSPMLPDVREAMTRAIHEIPGNASSVHQEGQRARNVVESARRAVASAVNAPGQAVVLTGGATESNNQVLHSHVRRVDDPMIACSAVEHPSVLEVVDRLETDYDVPVRRIGVDRDGSLDVDELKSALADGASLVSVMMANNETGVTYPVEEIAQMVHEADAEFHTDGTQAFGRTSVDFESIGADFMTLSFHKMGGPKGIGATVVSEGATLGAWMTGGHQERGRRAGTENVPAAAALEAAATAAADRTDAWHERLEAGRAAFRNQLNDELPSALNVEHRGQSDGLPNTLNLAFEQIDGEDMLMALDLEGVCASSGSACTAGSLEPSHVILAMGYDQPAARRSVRFSLGPTLERQTIQEAASRVGSVARRLSSI
jgi:cysteine desulfurase